MLQDLQGRVHGEESWRLFQQASSMADHWWWRPGWKPGRRFYTWHLTFENSPTVQELAKAYQDAIQLEFLDPVPAHGLHLTMQGVGFTDEVPDAEIAAIVESARNELKALSPYDLTVGPAYADAEGVPLSVDPWTPVEQTRHAVREAIRHVRGPENVPESAEGFVPHITVFYSNSESDPTPLSAALAPLRAMPPVTARVDTASLIRLGRDTHEYSWTTEAEVPLGPAQQSGT
jgi:2'-5' RNA ligase